MNMISVMAAVIISAIVAMGVFAHPADPYPSVMLSAIKTVDGTLAGASNAASTTSDGATVRFAPNGQGGTIVTVYAGRPDSPVQPPVTESYTIPNVSVTNAWGGAAFRIVVAHDGSGSFIEDSAQNGAAWQQVPNQLTGCETATLRFGNGNVWKTGTVSCTTLALTAD